MPMLFRPLVRGIITHPTSCLRTYHQKLRQYSTLLQQLERRGLVHQSTSSQELQDALETSSQTIYFGIDPTAPTLHVGHLIPLMCLLRFHMEGHRVIPLIGGATGLVGDPSERENERQLAEVKTTESNATNLSSSIKNFFDAAVRYALSRNYRPRNENAFSEITIDVENNLSWHKDFKLLDFLRDVGVYAKVNTMLNRQSVQKRMESSKGISFTEFTYQLLQGYDFYHLYKNFNCTIQLGGSDQRGNMLAGLDLIQRLVQTDSDTAPRQRAFSITTPLLTTASGAKFGKSAGNAIWMDTNLTSVFDFYQYFLQIADKDVEDYLKRLTLLKDEAIEEIMGIHRRDERRRLAQRTLAAEVTELVHGAPAVEQAEKMTASAFQSSGNDSSNLDADSLIAQFDGDPRFISCPREELLSVPVAKLISKYGLVGSNSAARVLIRGRGLSVNAQIVPEELYVIPESQLLDGRVALVKAGKTRVMLFVAS